MTSPPPRPNRSRLAIRFAVILALALLPAGVVAFIQTNALEKEVQVRTEIALLGATVQAAASETSLIGRVRGMVGTLAIAARQVLDDPVACTDLMRSVAAIEPIASVVAYVPRSGQMTCSSTGRTYDFSADPLFRKVIAANAPFFIVNPRSPLTGLSILGISHPVVDANGAYVGYAWISVPHVAMQDNRFDAFVSRRKFDAPLVFWTMDGAGNLLTANVGLDVASDQVPLGQPMQDFVGTEGSVFQATAANGLEMTYAVMPIFPGELYLMSSFLPMSSYFAFDHRMSVYLPTFLMWLVGLVTSAFAADLLVTRHVRSLHRSIVRFTKGDRREQTLTLQNAPVELVELAAAYMTMTDSITHGEAVLEDTIHQKEVLLREVHHRVKNNLQLISSIMNIQIRSAKSAEAKALLKSLQERIMSLATVHRGLYQTSGLVDVRARELIPDIVRQIMAMSSGPERPFHTATEIDDLRIVPDQAVPLSLLLVEALTNAMKHAGASRDHPARMMVRLRRTGTQGEAMLEVINSRRVDMPPAPPGSNTGIGTQLMGAFVRQLGGTQTTTDDKGDFALRVMFPLTPLVAAEYRQSATDPDTAAWTSHLS